jgi:putative transposase
MSSIKAYRYQLRCKPGQERQLQRWAGQLRWLWNQALAEQKARHARSEPYASYVDMCHWLTTWRNAPATQWLASGPVHPQQQALKRLDEAYKRFFARTGGFPRFKARGLEPGLRFPDPRQFALDAANGRIQLPKIGWVRLRYSRPAGTGGPCGAAGTLRNVTLTSEGAGKAQRWYASIQVQGDEELPAADLTPTLGIDLGVAAFAATSEDVLVAPLGALKRQAQRLRRYQRSVSRKKKGSCNRKKAVMRLAALHRRIARQRSDWLHQLSTALASEHPVIAIEDLKVAAMSASARGTAQAPGRRVKQKAGLNRAMLDAAWAEFRRQLQYKTAACGGAVIAVNPAYTSRTCRCCAHECADNRKTQAIFSCVACGHTENADVHAAKVILARGITAWRESGAQPAHHKPTNQTAAGHAATACGGAIRRSRRASAAGAAPTKQEPTEEVAHA